MATTARTDIHRPGAANFDPQAYTFTGVVIDSDNITTGDRENITAVAQGREPAMDYQCGHCGAWLRYAALLKHTATGELIWVGNKCLGNRFSGMTAGQFAALQAAAKQARLDAKISQARAAFLAAHPLFTQLTDELCADSEFLGSLRYQVQAHGELSERQIAAGEKAITRAIEFAAKRAQWAAERAAAPVVPAPLGRVIITGKVIKVSWLENDFGGREVMTVKHADGWCAWGTVPASISDDVKTGATVTFTATLALFDDEDPKVDFVKFTRPTKASITQ